MSEPGGDPSSGISSGDALILPERHPACRRREARPGFRPERENLRFVTSDDVKGQAASGSNREGESTEAERRGGAARSSDEGPVMGLERRGCVVRPWPLANWKREEPVDEVKPFKATAEHREPCDSRGSCTVLGAPGGEIPPGDSTTAEVLRSSGSVSFTSESRRSAGSLNRYLSASCGHPTVRLETGGDDTNQRRHLRRLLRYAAVGVSSRRVFCRESATRQQLP